MVQKRFPVDRLKITIYSIIIKNIKRRSFGVTDF